MIDLSSNQPLYLVVFERVIRRHVEVLALIVALLSIAALAVLH